MQDKSAIFLIAIAVTIGGLALLGKERLDNPLFFLIMIAVFVCGVQAVGRWGGSRLNAPGVVTFFGGK